jgi:hypothetical protein
MRPLGCCQWPGIFTRSGADYIISILRLSHTSHKVSHACLHLNSAIMSEYYKSIKMPTVSRLITVKPMAHVVTSASSFLDGADAFLQGECALLRIPHLNLLSQAVTTQAGSPLPPTSGGNTPQHFAFVRSSVLLANGSYEVVVYPVVSFSNQGGALTGHARLPPALQAHLIPLPPLLPAYTPVAFGNPLDLGAFTLDRESWLLVDPHKFIMPEHRAVSPFRCQ